MFRRIKESDDENRPRCDDRAQSVPDRLSQGGASRQPVRCICRNLYVFAMDEYANEEGRIAPEDWQLGFMHSLLQSLYSRFTRSCVRRASRFIGPSNANIDVYGKMIADLGDADICYSGPGWTGHMAFIEPDAPEFDAPLEEWKHFGPRVCTLSPFTIAQNSLHGSFGMSGDIAAVPPKAATIGPAEVIAAKNRIGNRRDHRARHGDGMAAAHRPALLPRPGDAPAAELHPPRAADRLLYQRIDRPRHRARLGERLLGVCRRQRLHLRFSRLEWAKLELSPCPRIVIAARAEVEAISDRCTKYFKGLCEPGQAVPGRRLNRATGACCATWTATSTSISHRAST